MSILTLPHYISGLVHLKDKSSNVRKVSLACLIFVADTLIGLLYTFYFIYFWFSREDNNPTADPLAGDAVGPREIQSTATISAASSKADILASQSASPGRELFLTLGLTIIVTVLRFYFTLIIISFTKGLHKQDSLNIRYDDGSANVDEPPSSGDGYVTKYKKFVYDLEIKSKQLLRDFFS